MDQSNSQESGREHSNNLDEDMYVVDKILKKRTIFKHGKQTVMYFVRWEGYPNIEDHTWEPEQNLSSVPTLIKEFEQKLQQKKRKEQKQLEQSKNKEDYVKHAANNLQVKQNDGEFRKIQNQQNEALQKPYKLLKKNNSALQNSESSYTFGRKDNFIIKEGLQAPKSKNKDITKPQAILSFKKIEPKDTLTFKQSIREGQVRTGSKDRKEYGQVVNHIYSQGKILYEVQILSKDKRVKHIEQISSQIASAQCQKSTLQYLQKMLVRMQQLNRQE